MHTQQHQIGSRIDVLFAALWQAGGTDLLLTVGMPPMLRVDGALIPTPGTTTLTAEDTEDDDDDQELDEREAVLVATGLASR